MIKSNHANPIYVGLDIGYGVVKIVSPDRQPILFPSVMGMAREVRFRAEELAKHHPGDQINDDDGDWFVGHCALKHLMPGELVRLRGRTSDSDTLRLRLAKVALGKLLAEEAGKKGDVLQVVISTGLPVGHMRNAHALKKALLGRLAIITDQCKFIADVVDVMVMPQPQGTLYTEQLTPEGKINPSALDKRLGVVDVGMFTIDISVNDDGEYVDALSDTVSAGVHLAHERVAEVIESRDNQKADYGRIEKVLMTGCDKAFGKVEDMRRDVEAAFEPTRQAALTLMRSKWERAADLDRILITGGGAARVEDAIKTEYPHAEAVGNPQLANAQGYLNYARFVARG